MIRLRDLKRYIKFRLYCDKCGALLIKKIYGVKTFYNNETGKAEKWGKVSVKCPNRVFLNLTAHTEFNLGDDIGYDE